MTSIHYRFGAFRLDPESRELWRDDHLVQLPRRSFDCLLHLLEHRDRACNRDELVGVGWGHTSVSDAQLGQVVLRLRRALDDDGQVQQVIRTVPGFGYRWVAPTEAIVYSADTLAADPDASTVAPIDAAPIVPGSNAPPESAGKPEPVSEAGGRPTWPLLWLAALVLAVAGVALLTHRNGDAGAAGHGPPGEAVTPSAVVLPLEVNGSADASWLRLGAMDLVIHRLREAGLGALQSETVIGLLANGGGRSALADYLVVRGTAVQSGPRWRVTLDAQAPDGFAHHASAENDDPIQATRSAADLLTAALGRLPGDKRDSSEASLQTRLQRSQAALLANELDAARAILLDGSPADDAAPAPVRYRLGQIDLRAGRFASAEAAFDRLLQEPAMHEDAQLHAQVLCARGALYGHLDRFAEAERDFDDAAGIARAGAFTEELGRALNGRGAARSALQKFDESLTDLGQARIELGKIGDELGIARVDNNIGALESERARPAQALPFFLESSARFARLGAINEQVTALIGLGNVQASLLQWREALQTATRGWALGDKVRDPTQRIHLAVGLAEAYLALGRQKSAGDALRAVDPLTQATDGASLGRLRATEAEIAWQEHRDADAVVAGRQALAAWPADPHDAWRARAALTYLRALIGSGQADPDNPPHELGLKAGDTAFDDSLPAHVLALAEWAEFTDRPGEAGQLFGRAVSLAETRGVPAEIVDTVDAWARRLLASGRIDESTPLVGRVAAWASTDYPSAMLQVRLFHATGQTRAWQQAVEQATLLAGERRMPGALAEPPPA